MLASRASDDPLHDVWASVLGEVKATVTSNLVRTQKMRTNLADSMAADKDPAWKVDCFTDIRDQKEKWHKKFTKAVLEMAPKYVDCFKVLRSK